MLKTVTEKDKYGNSQTRFYLTQGDSFTLYVVPKKDGEIINFATISKCLFKVSDEDYTQEFQKELTADSTNNRYVLNLTSEETAKLDVATHIYEIEYTFTDGTVYTPNSWKFDIVDQII